MFGGCSRRVSGSRFAGSERRLGVFVLPAPILGFCCSALRLLVACCLLFLLPSVRAEVGIITGLSWSEVGCGSFRWSNPPCACLFGCCIRVC